MGYYQEVVVEYLRESRAIFINTECCIQLNKGANADVSGPHWYCDAIAVEFFEKEKPAVYLCEVSYAKGLAALLKRLSEWNTYWPGIKASLVRDSKLKEEWSVTPWLFIPEDFRSAAEKRIKTFTPDPGGANAMPFPKIYSLESIVPWNPARRPKAMP